MRLFHVVLAESLLSTQTVVLASIFIVIILLMIVVFASKSKKKAKNRSNDTSPPPQILPSQVQHLSPVSSYLATPTLNLSHPVSVSKPPFFVFVSHSSRDDAFGRVLARDLRKAIGSYEAVWYDSDGGLYAGDSWWNRIISIVSMCDVFVIIISPDSMISPWVIRELDMAIMQNKRVVPLLYRQCTIRPDLLAIQYISFLTSAEYPAGFNRLLQALKR